VSEHHKNSDPFDLLEQPNGAAFSLRRVLTVDDSSLIRAALRGIFSEAGIAVEEAKNGTEALERIQEVGRFDLILLDLIMPDIGGLEVLTQIRTISSDVVVVMLTSSDDMKSAIRAIREGADGYLQKGDMLISGDRREFFYALEQASNYRNGLIAQRQLEQLKLDLYSMVTHDLRNPASVIGLSMELFLEGTLGELSTDQRAQIQIADEAAQKILNLVTDYLDYAKIDAGYFKLESAPLELNDVVYSCVRQARVLLEAKGQHLHFEPGEIIPLEGDEARVKQVMDNLLSNASKYTPEGGTITVSVGKYGNHIRIKIQDTGRGIPPELLPRLFGKYQRLPGENRRTQGTGLGLVICKTIIEAHGGRIWAESQGIVGKGSSFIVELPQNFTP
jgi:two-component system, sensor histidine kinase and response regulator